MNGIYMEHTDNQLVMVATDGKRLSCIKKSVGEDIPEFKGVIIPPKVLNLARRLMSGEGSIALSIDEKRLFLNLAGQRISSTLIDGQFPNYKRVIPEQQEHTITIDREELSDALKRASLFAERSRRVVVHLSKHEITFFSKEDAVGNTKEQIGCEYDGPDDVAFGMNCQFLSDPIKVMDCDKLTIRFTEASKAMTIDPLPKSDYFHIVMPMQTE